MCSICESLVHGIQEPRVGQFLCYVKGKDKAVPLQAWSGPECSRKLRFPDFMTTAQDGGKVITFNMQRFIPTAYLLANLNLKIVRISL